MASLLLDHKMPKTIAVMSTHPISASASPAYDYGGLPRKSMYDRPTLRWIPLDSYEYMQTRDVAHTIASLPHTHYTLPWYYVPNDLPLPLYPLVTDNLDASVEPTPISLHTSVGKNNNVHGVPNNTARTLHFGINEHANDPMCSKHIETCTPRRCVLRQIAIPAEIMIKAMLDCIAQNQWSYGPETLNSYWDQVQQCMPEPYRSCHCKSTTTVSSRWWKLRAIYNGLYGEPARTALCEQIQSLDMPVDLFAKNRTGLAQFYTPIMDADQRCTSCICVLPERRIPRDVMIRAVAEYLYTTKTKNFTNVSFDTWSYIQAAMPQPYRNCTCQSMESFSNRWSRLRSVCAGSHGKVQKRNLRNQIVSMALPLDPFDDCFYDHHMRSTKKRYAPIRKGVCKDPKPKRTFF